MHYEFNWFLAASVVVTYPGGIEAFDAE